jgi:Putative bacterial sensory transduction regulator
MRPKPLLRLLVAGALALAAAPAARVAAQGDVWSYTGEDDEQAAQQLVNFFKGHDVEVTNLSKKQITIRYKKYSFHVLPLMNAGPGLDRLAVYEVFETKDRWKGTPQLMQFANTLNKAYNIGCFYLDEDDDLIFRTQVTFIDRLEWRHIRAFFDWAEEATTSSKEKYQADFERFLK